MASSTRPLFKFFFFVVFFFKTYLGCSPSGIVMPARIGFRSVDYLSVAIVGHLGFFRYRISFVISGRKNLSKLRIWIHLNPLMRLPDNDSNLSTYMTAILDIVTSTLLNTVSISYPTLPRPAPPRPAPPHPDLPLPLPLPLLISLFLSYPSILAYPNSRVGKGTEGRGG